MKLYSILLFFLTCRFAAAQSGEQVIRDLRQRSNEAIARHDTASLAKFWLNDVHVLTSRSVSLSGRQANQKAFQNEFEAKEELLYVRTPTTVEIFPDWDMAAEYGRWTGTWKTNGLSTHIGGSYYAKWHKTDGVWKIKAEIYTPAVVNESAIVVQNFYYPKPGKENEVLETRQRASKVRGQLGLPVGRILLRTSVSTTQPYIIWECEYPSLQAREEDVAKLDGSEDFTKVQEHMGTLLEKFDRSRFKDRKVTHSFVPQRIDGIRNSHVPDLIGYRRQRYQCEDHNRQCNDLHVHCLVIFPDTVHQGVHHHAAQYCPEHE